MEINQSLGLENTSLHDTIILWIGTVLFVMTIILASVQIFVRVVDVGVTLRWTEALARYVLIVGTYFGAAVATRNREHIRITLFLDWLRDRNANMYHGLDVFIQFVVITFVIIGVYSTLRAASGGMATNLPGTDFVTAGMLYLAIALGLTAMLVYELLYLYSEYGESIKNRSRNTDVESN